MADVKITKRDQVKECIELGSMTKVQIAEQLEMTTGSASTQMTYLRWMGLFILTDPETKVLSFTDEETFNASVATKKSGSKAKVSARTPAERAVALAKTMANQAASKAKWEAKVAEISEILASLPDDQDAALNLKEANANVDLFDVKIIRNLALAETLPCIEDAEAEIAADAVVDAAIEEDDTSEEVTDELL